MTISGRNGEQLRGFLVVAWNSALTRVGNFVPADSASKTACAVSLHTVHRAIIGIPISKCIIIYTYGLCSHLHVSYATISADIIHNLDLHFLL